MTHQIKIYFFFFLSCIICTVPSWRCFSWRCSWTG